ncbi:MAG: family 78 glycoside hydrolase catalytic domain [Lachnospiraceae bacterium]|nr:family 78 glycoside hydrolase catalytic domain [Lachnospiraceae bacterium]
MRAIRLQTEYLMNPIGIDIASPNLYWNCESGIRQSAYEITAKKDGETIWESGKVQSSRMTQVPYEGPALQSRDRIDWSVRLFDENDEPGGWSEASFEMGLLRKSDWTAKWITGNYTPKKNVRYPADCFKKEFSFTGIVKKARLYVTACGLYDVSLNGQRVSGCGFNPGFTDYRKRLQYQVYDVTEMINAENTLEVLLGDGWFRGSAGCYGKTAVYGRETRLLFQLEITDTQGEVTTVISDASTRWSNDGPIRFNDMKDGEIYDASMTASYNGFAKETVCYRKLVSGNNVPMKEMEHFTAQEIVTPSGVRLLDFGQNIAGVVQFKVKGEKGQKIRMLFGENLDKNGEFTQENMQVYTPEKEFGGMKEILVGMGVWQKKSKHLRPTPKQEIVFTCSGGEDFYKMRFGIFGFRYALIETDIDRKAEDFESIAVYSDLEQTGDFSCSNADVNRLVRNIRWSMKSNYLDVPTDCPTRERMGWTGDAQIFFKSGTYLMNTAAFMRKFLQDMEDGVMKNGVVPAVVPYCGVDMIYRNTATSAGFADAAVLIPYRYWKQFGDRRILEHFYDTVMKPVAEFEVSHTGHKDRKEAKENPYNQYVYEKGTQIGEWLEPAEFVDTISASSLPKQTEVATAYLHYTTTLMAEAAEELGRTEDAEKYREYAEGSRKAYEWLYLRNGTPDTDRQAKLVRPLALGLADETQKKDLEERLLKAVRNRNYRIGTGFLSTSFTLGVLSDAGYSADAYKMLLSEEAPGWLYEVKQGATTIWENWEGNGGSMNHYSPGSVYMWMVEHAAGIRQDGENRFRIAPEFDASMDHAEASWKSLYGEVKSRWERSGEAYRLSVTVPANTEAEVVLPDGRTQTVEAGEHSFEV